MCKGKCIECCYVVENPVYLPERSHEPRYRCGNVESLLHGKKFNTPSELENFGCADCKLKDNNITPIIKHDMSSTIVIENDRDRFVNILNGSHAETFEEIVQEFISRYGDNITADCCCTIIGRLNDILYPKIAKYNRIKNVSKERAGYLLKYLKGEMYSDTDDCDELETRRKIQTDNAKYIIDVCDGKEKV